LSCFFFGPCCARIGRQRLPSYFWAGLLPRGEPYALVGVLTGLIINGLDVYSIIRLGLLAEVAAFAFQGCLLENFPLTTQASSWYAGISLAGIVLMAALVFYSFYISLGGRPIFGSAVLEE